MRIASLLALCLAATIVHAGDLPDPKITPGALDSEVSQANIKESICKQTHYTWSEAHQPPVSFLQEVFDQQSKAYGLTDTNFKHYQMDHLIPLSLGGHPTDPKNLWPQLLLTKWSARRKDYLEEEIHIKVCNGELALGEAQELFRSNWIEAYKRFIGDLDQTK